MNGNFSIAMLNFRISGELPLATWTPFFHPFFAKACVEAKPVFFPQGICWRLNQFWAWNFPIYDWLCLKIGVYHGIPPNNTKNNNFIIGKNDDDKPWIFFRCFPMGFFPRFSGSNPNQFRHSHAQEVRNTSWNTWARCAMACCQRGAVSGLRLLLLPRFERFPPKVISWRYPLVMTNMAMVFSMAHRNRPFT